MPAKIRHFLKSPLLGIALIISSSIFPISITSVMAGVTFKPPGAQAPQRSSGGGSRDGDICGFGTKVSNSVSVTPLMPNSNIGFTVADRPTIFVYLPGSKAQKALFTLQDDGSKTYYQTTLTLPQKPGVMEVKLPTSVPALKTNKNYKWSLVMICTEELDTDSPWVGGWIRRVEADRTLTSNNQKPISLELISKLAETGIWYDSLSILAELRRSQPNNQALTNAWQDLLKSVNLNVIANEPLVN
ncbi:hypothetical protein NIES37_23590 [Tolypothrix tenuis PCC 7101]|uniref:DUF928 domain-containing protein n=1 Tax=Tolypothrix tenuis PCC 7101 TaxID=231146 RepID=A0A1Z4MY87_9CYAN|nr:DUF928 domain-containing protein [Aulosira sp. FACHB-113]BAY98409.1 hypothetical protein NIES37_23590 [Tolypothrix tenuis PCC 7101]BAZ77672.1 hypothetical protein NIES50_63030 [Aulosira laxa NIES-50]